MSRIALTRLLVANDRSARRRLAGIVAGVMVGVALFLMLLAAAQAFPERSLRSSWASTALLPGVSQQSSHTDLQPDHVLKDSELAVASNLDTVGPETITVLQVALPESGTTSVRLPGSDVVPKQGEYLASPALAKRIASLPADQLGDRYGKQVGVLAPDAVEGPDSLVAVVGTELGTVASSQSHIPPQVVTAFTGIPYENEAYRIAMLIGAIAVLVPALLLVGIVTDLGAAQRAERFATLRLIGATPQQVARTAALEIGATTFVGALAGVALYLVMIPVAAQISLGSSRFYYSDLLRSPVNAVLAVAVTTAGAAAVAWWRTRRADVGPLGGSRERSERRPRLISLAPVILGMAGLVSTPAVARQESALTIYLLPISFLCAMLGLLWAGPVLTWWVARGGRALARSAAQVIGFNRIARHPRAVFRAVAGVVVAVYAMTVFAVAITVAAGTRDIAQGNGHLSPTTLEAIPTVGDEGTLESAVDRLAAVPGVTTVAVGRISGDSRQEGQVILEADKAEALGAPHMESPGGAVSISTRWLYENAAASPSPVSAEDLATAREQGAPILLVGTDPASPGAVERARTALATSNLELGASPSSPNSIQSIQASAMENQFARLGYIGILIAAGISTVSLGVSTVAALLGRKRVLGLLRLVGMPPATLRSMVSYETVLPAATALVMSIGLGWLTAWSLVGGVSGRHISWPDGGYWLVLGACLALVAVATLVSARYGRRMLASTTVRFE
ncbi:efflux ABC transporter, permease protein [Actinomyces johnsonii F0542]|uniref:Efflux ABC transporter, permease protein n=1 Tax=Actinomyces johnsonii F0542 TaxID=1321818 RepID=U1RT85_9ACTO|nr:ABC transporter permease [Actinomyces johnsonii]ERH21667.1 efflux ABC transporter, permease protein [Actinomyces johnsonii F0542]